MKLMKFLGGWRRALLRLLGWLSCAMVYALYYATVFVILQGEGALPGRLWWGLLSLVPMAAADLGTQLTRRLWQYLLWAVGVCLLCWPLLGHPLAAAPVALVCFFRGKNSLPEEPVDSSMDRPHLVMAAAMVPPFVYSAVDGAPLLQKACLVWTAAYLLLWAGDAGFRRIDHYLTLNRGMAGLPGRRILRTSGLPLLGMLLLAAALLVPALLMGKSTLRINMDPPKGQSQFQFEQAAPQDNMAGIAEMLEGLGDAEPSFHIPQFVIDFFMAVIGLVVLAFAAYCVYAVVRGLRSSFVDHQDVVQFLGTKDEEAQELPAAQRVKRPALWDRSPSAQVRRRYRRAVLQAGKEPPPRWAAPQEIEARAGLDDRQLHLLYEKARYSQEGCTAQESRSLKR